MREDNFQLSQHFINGLRAYDRQTLNIPALADAYGVEARAEGLYPASAVTQPFSAAELTDNSVTVVFPFPQLLRGRGMTILADEDALFLVNEATWDLTPITTYDYYSASSTKAITAGGIWHMSDFFNTVLLYNGSCTVIKLGNDAKWYVEDTVTITTGCNHKGRLISGGFDSSDYWSAVWKAIHLTRANTAQYTTVSIPAELSDIGKNWIHYGTIGGGDLQFVYNPALAFAGPLGVGNDSFIPLYMEYIRRNEQGWMPMTFQGRVLAIIPLGQLIVVYGEDGINVLAATSQPIPTYGLLASYDIGISDRGSAVGDDRGHVFVSENGCLYSIDPTGKLAKLGYEEFISPIVAKEIVMTKDSEQSHIRIATEDYSFLLSEKGLTENPQHVTSSAFVQGGLVGLFETNSDAGVTVVTNEFDMGIRAIKQIVGVEITGAPVASLRVAVDYRYDSGTAWKRTRAVPVSPTGYGYILIAGVEFRLVVTSTTRTGFNLKDVQVKWVLSDKRGVRGPYGQRG